MSGSLVSPQREGAPGAAAADRAGQGLSLLCLAHCFATPLLLGAFPAAGAALESPRVHGVLAALVLGVALLAFVPGYRRHHRRRVPLLGLLAGALLLAGLRAGEEGGAGAALTVLGSGAMVAAHALNRAAAPVRRAAAPG
jgi:hypothetical protein